MAATEILMPSLAEGMEEATIIAWFKEVGDPISVGDELIEVETDKATMEVEAEAGGVLREVVAELGSLVEVGEPIARIGDEADMGADGASTPDAPSAPVGDSSSGAAADRPDAGPSAAAPEWPPATGGAAARVEPARPAEPVVPMGGDRLRVSPLARRIAQDRDVDLHAVTGTGPSGRIIRADIDRALAAGPPAGRETTAVGAADAQVPVGDGDLRGRVETVELTRVQETIARRMVESKSTAPHFNLQARIDVSAMVTARAALKREAGAGEVVPSLNDFVVKGCALALRGHELANGSYRDGRFELYSRVNVGIAVARSDALVVPTIFDADAKGLAQIATESRELAQKVRDGSIGPSELAGGTFTVSNLGMYGIESFQAVINPPQAAILAVGEVAEVPTLLDEELVTRSMMAVTLCCDHRILYGAQAAEFLAAIRSYLEQPLRMAL